MPKQQKTKLEETLDLPSLSDALEESKVSKEKEALDAEEKEVDELEETMKELSATNPQSASDFKNALDSAAELENTVARHADFKEHDDEMNEVSAHAMESYEMLMDFGMNCTPAHAGSIFDTAATMLKISLDARNSKSDKKLKVWRLQIEQARLMRDMEKQRDDSGEIIDNNNNQIKGSRNAIIEGIKSGKISLDD